MAVVAALLVDFVGTVFGEGCGVSWGRRQGRRLERRPWCRRRGLQWRCRILDRRGRFCSCWWRWGQGSWRIRRGGRRMRRSLSKLGTLGIWAGVWDIFFVWWRWRRTWSRRVGDWAFDEFVGVVIPEFVAYCCWRGVRGWGEVRGMKAPVCISNTCALFR